MPNRLETSEQATSSQVPALLLALKALKRDPNLAFGARGARKLVVTDLLPAKEETTGKVVWDPPDRDAKCQVEVSEDVEVAVFTHRASQDRHYHKRATEVYVVLEGRMEIEVEDRDYCLQRGDSIVINPRAVHLVKAAGTEFICLVVAANSGGTADKFLP